MSSGQREIALRAAVLEWQKKYGVNDGDPLLASLELFQIYFGTFASAPPEGVSFPSFEEFRESIELLDRRSRSFSKQASELMEALRTIPNIKRQLLSYRTITFVLTVFCTLALGVLIGKFIL